MDCWVKFTFTILEGKKSPQIVYVILLHSVDFSFLDFFVELI